MISKIAQLMAIFIVTSLLIGGCGVKGDLYLPDEKQSQNSDEGNK